MIRFRVNWEKCIDAVDYLARRQDGITQYYVGKVCYFADKEHLLDYGRPITGDTYVAMEHGPVPSHIYDLLKEDTGLPDDVLIALGRRLRFRRNGNLKQATSRKRGDLASLSKTDKEYLAASLRRFGSMGFAELKRLSHDDAWSAAWSEPGMANQMNPEHWLSDLGKGEAAALAYLSDRRVRAV